MRARIAFDAERGKEPPELLLAAARRLEAIDPPLAREVYLDAMSAAFFAARLGGGGDPRAIARAAREAPSSDAPPRPCDHLLDGLVLLILDGPAAATGRLREALDAFREEEPGSEEGLRWFWLAGRVAGYIWDYETWALLTARQIRAAREVGALSYLPLALSSQVGVHMFAGEVRAATAVLEEGNVLSDATAGHVHLPYGHQGMAAFSGREADLVRMLGSARDGYFVRGEGLGLTASHWMTALLYNGLGRYEDAFAAAGQATIDSREIWFSTLAAVELIEAAVRTDHDESARTAFAVLSESTRASATPWALGVEARCQALLSRGDEARSLYREAIERLKPTRLRVDLARTHLVHGEWLRRERRRVDARTELRTAHELFTEFGMNAFAERARLELEATGERARKRHAGTIDELTPREAQIARLAAEGETNREIAAQLFISLSTVEYHLRKVFRKLGVRSRTQLSHRLSQDR
jgi:DNA-binding CsgD family transcriptional regulator